MQKEYYGINEEKSVLVTSNPPLQSPSPQLEDTQEEGGARGDTPAHAAAMEDKCASKSSRKCLNPKPTIVQGTPIDRVTEELDAVRCFRIKSMDSACTQ